MKQGNRSWLILSGWAALVLLVGITLCIVELQHLQGHITIGNRDYFGMAARAPYLPGDLSAWVDGFYPVGIPLLARLGLALGVDVAHFGRIVSILGGLLCVLGTAALALHLTHSRVFALFTIGFLISTGTLLFYAGYEGTDMLSAGLQVLALGVLSRNVQDRRLVFAAGMITGLGYLIRYTALVFFLIGAGYWVLLALYHKDIRRLWPIPFFALGFVIGAAPQIVTSLMVTGKPFHMTQAYHIWIKLYGSDDFVATWGSDAAVSLPRLIALDPARFMRNWWSEFTGFWLNQNPPLVDQPLSQFSRAGLLLLAFDRRMRREHRLMLAWFAVGLVAALSIFTINTRFLIVLLPTFMISAVYIIWRVIPAIQVKNIRVPLNILALLGLLVVAAPALWTHAHSREGGPHANAIETSNRMHTAGAHTAQEITTTGPYHQDVASPTRDSYPQLHTMPHAESPSQWRDIALTSGVRFLIYDDNTGSHYFAQYKNLLNPMQRIPGYTPIWIPEKRTFVAYRIEPDTPQPAYPLHEQFENGIELLGYDLATHEYQPEGSGNAIGLYLYWKTTRPVSATLKVFTHVIDAQGALVGQDDSLPVLWMYPVENWQIDEVVIDYHAIALQPQSPLHHLSLQTGFYDAGSGERVPVLNTSEHSAGDKILLATVNIDSSEAP